MKARIIFSPPLVDPKVEFIIIETQDFDSGELIQWVRLNSELIPIHRSVLEVVDENDQALFFGENNNIESDRAQEGATVQLVSQNDNSIENLEPKPELNTAPSASDDNYEISVNSELSVSLESGVLANDSDADGDSLTVSQVEDVSHGTLTLNADGTFTYTPNEGFEGTDSFVYQVRDGNGGVSEATASIDVSVPTATIIGTSGADNLVGSAGVNDDIYSGGVGAGSENVQGVEGSIGEAQAGHEGSGNDRLIFAADAAFVDDARSGSGHLRIRDFTVGVVSTDVDADTLVLGDFLRANDPTFDGSAEDALRFLHFVESNPGGRLLYIDATGNLGDADSAARNISGSVYHGIDGGVSLFLEFKGAGYNATPNDETLNTVDHIQMLMDNSFLDFS